MRIDRNKLSDRKDTELLLDIKQGLQEVTNKLNNIESRLGVVENVLHTEPSPLNIQTSIQEIRKNNIEKCIECMDWGKIWRVMNYLDWQWIGQMEDGKPGIPTMDSMINHVRSDLNRCYEMMDKYIDDNPNDIDNYFIESGGFRVRTFIDNGCEVMFILSDASTRY